MALHEAEGQPFVCWKIIHRYPRAPFLTKDRPGSLDALNGIDTGDRNRRHRAYGRDFSIGRYFWQDGLPRFIRNQFCSVKTCRSDNQNIVFADTGGVFVVGNSEQSCKIALLIGNSSRSLSFSHSPQSGALWFTSSNATLGISSCFASI